MLPRHARCGLSRLRCNGHSLFLSSYRTRIGRTENPSSSACGHPFRDTSNLILYCPAMNSLHCSLFGDSLSLYDLWSRPWGVAQLLGLYGYPPYPSYGYPSLERGRVTTTTTRVGNIIPVTSYLVFVTSNPGYLSYFSTHAKTYYHVITP